MGRQCGALMASEREPEKKPAKQAATKAAKKAEVFHAPFAGALRERQKAEAQARAHAAEEAKAQENASAAVTPVRVVRAPAQAPTRPELPDDALFLQAMTGVAAIPGAQRPEAPRPPPPPPSAAPSEDGEAMAQLADLCAGVGEFSLEDTLEYVEGCASGVDRRIVRRLRRGEYSVQAHLDLHGLTRDEARAEVERFVTLARTRGLRCVLIVHGRGLNSKDKIPVLKQSVVAWLQRGRMGKGVLAFATARPHDGGAGAVYVLLKK